MDPMGLDGTDEDEMNKKIEIAQITFAYDNAEVIEQLISRGNYVKAEQWGKLESINDEILAMIKE